MARVSSAFLTFSVCLLTVSFESVALAQPSFQPTLPKQCEQLFNETDMLIKSAEQQPGTHFQMSNIKDRIQATKEKILMLEPQIQSRSCDKGLIALNNLKQR